MPLRNDYFWLSPRFCSRAVAALSSLSPLPLCPRRSGRPHTETPPLPPWRMHCSTSHSPKWACTMTTTTMTAMSMATSTARTSMQGWCVRVRVRCAVPARALTTSLMPRSILRRPSYTRPSSPTGRLPAVRALQSPKHNLIVRHVPSATPPPISRMSPNTSAAMQRTQMMQMADRLAGINPGFAALLRVPYKHSAPPRRPPFAPTPPGVG
jgi:hypothetical protein